MTFYIPLKDVTQPDLSKTTLILPSISIGNIPQLTIDLLIHNYDFTKIGYLDDLYLYPFASPVDYATPPPPPGISHAVEVYHSAKLGLVLVQQRSPIAPTYTPSYVMQIIVPFIQNNKFSKCVILNSADAGVVEGIASGTIRVYTAHNLVSSTLEKLSISKGKELEDVPRDDDNGEDDHSNRFVKTLLSVFNLPRGERAVVELKDVEVVLVVSYAYEGDNFHDARSMFDAVLGELKIEKKTTTGGGVVEPVSWHGAYGDKDVPSAMEEGIFG
ncbi:uncharacterized protein LODBEIA_P36900 [Lodderomyces beijingensis]|uniref:Proteasome assembly chaperone 2 n=1 Tax=Lodderomyces beijingensis TaxID=1775926 RepID=A0ABP0ZRD4_9ASCO